MLGSVAGDIIGSPYEWNNTDDRFFELCRSTRGSWRGREVAYHPRFTGDSVMTLAVAGWLMQDRERLSSRLSATMRATAQGYTDRGFGPAFRRWLEDESARPNNSYGNICAVRAAPVGLVADDLPEALALARQTAEVSHSHPEGIKGAQAIAQAVWMARHGRSKEDIRFATEQEFGYDLGMPEDEMRQLLQGCTKESVIVNGEETGGFYFRETGRFNSSCQDTVPAAIRAFLEGDSFEDTVRRAVSYGGDSNSIASMAGAIAEPFYGGVPEKIRGLCEVYLTHDMKERMESFERVMLRKEMRTGRIDRGLDDMFRMLKTGEGKTAYVVPGYRRDIIEALKRKFGPDTVIIGPRKQEEWLGRNCTLNTGQGTYLDRPPVDCRILFYRDGVFHSPTTYPYPDGPSEEERRRAFGDFQKMKEYALEVKSRLQAMSGYSGEDSIHYATAYFPVIYHSWIEVWKGDTFAGSIGIDPMSGLIRMNEGGDMGPCEWGEDRCFSVFWGTDLDSFREALGRWCLDEGIGLGDRCVRLNADRINDDIARCTDGALNAAIENSNTNKKSL